MLVNLGSVLGTKMSKTLVLAWSDLDTFKGDRPYIPKRILGVTCFHCDLESSVELETCTGLVTHELKSLGKYIYHLSLGFSSEQWA